eukprot:g10223.t1
MVQNRPGNTPPTDLLQYVPHDAQRADVLSLGCGDLRDLLYSMLLHGRRPRTVSFMLNDYEPAVHARNLILLQLLLDSRSLLESSASAGVDGIAAGVKAVHIQGGEHEKEAEHLPPRRGAVVEGQPGAGGGGAFAQRIGVIFRQGVDGLCVMYNVFVDKAELGTIHDAAGRLSASAATASGWASTELGGLVRFTDDRSRDRVRKILSAYTDRGLQEHGVLVRVRRERSAVLDAFLPDTKDKESSFVSRAMGLSSYRIPETGHADDDMRRKYLRDGVLDPFPLLCGGGSAPKRKRGGRAKLVNPLLLVTERKGTEYSLHYGAFPLDAFNTDVAMWKLRPEGMQGEYGKLAPRVTKHEVVNSYIGRNGPSAARIAPRVAQDAWLGVALEELGQMCGAFLEATASRPASTSSSLGTRLRVDVHVGDALDFCDALSAVPSTAAGGNDGGRQPPAATSSVEFQQGTLQPLELQNDVFGGAGPAFDVIKTSNLADHLGIVNLVMAAAPLLKGHSQAVLLSSYLSTVRTRNQYQGIADFYEKLLCMDFHSASLLLGVVPVSSISSVVGHADVMSQVDEVLHGGSTGTPSLVDLPEGRMSSQLRLAWKRPPQALAAASSAALPTAGPTGVLVDISPDDFARLVLPVYKAMFEHMPTSEMMASPLFKRPTVQEIVRSVTKVRHYTSVAFGRLLVSAGRKLRLDEAHFEAALEAVIHNGGLILAPNLQLEQAAVFHALGLAVGPSRGLLVDTLRVVLLVPQSGLLLLRAFEEFKQPELFLALSGKALPFDNHFVSVHTAFVRVRRGSIYHHHQDEIDGWRALSDNLTVRDASEDDPEAELMTSALVPTSALMLAPPALTDLELRLRCGAGLFAAPKDILKKLARECFGVKSYVFYGADLANTDRTAVLAPGDFAQGRVFAHPRLVACAQEAVVRLPKPHASRPATSSKKPVGKTSQGRPAVMHRFLHGGAAVDQSVELITQPCGSRKGASSLLCYRVTLSMESAEAQQRLAEGRGPVVERTPDPCTVRVKLGEGLSHAVSFPFPVGQTPIEIKFNNRQGYVIFTVPPLPRGQSTLPFAWTGCDDSEGASRGVLPSTPAWSPCPPITSLPRLDFNAEWANGRVLGGLCLTPAEESQRDRALPPKGGGADLALVGMKTDGPAIWVWVNDILLESSNEALILDCCIMQVRRMKDAASTQLGAAIELDEIRGDRGQGMMIFEAYPGEMALWESLLPVAVERARQSYTHTAECAYTRPRESRRSVLCSCGEGKDLPSAFEESMIKQIHPLGMSSVHPLFYRAALSPLFAPTEAFSAAQSLKNTTASAATGCVKCGKGGTGLMMCARCRKVAYCSKECQRLDWKVHKRTCSA